MIEWATNNQISQKDYVKTNYKKKVFFNGGLIGSVRVEKDADITIKDGSFQVQSSQ